MKPPRFPLRPHPGLGRPEEAAGQREPSFVSVGAPQTTAQALYWMGAMSSHPAGAYGGAQTSLQLLAKPGRLNLVDSIAWRGLLQAWTQTT